MVGGACACRRLEDGIIRPRPRSEEGWLVLRAHAILRKMALVKPRPRSEEGWFVARLHAIVRKMVLIWPHPHLEKKTFIKLQDLKSISA